MANSGRVLITGATGKVGSALLDNLANDDIELRALAHDESEAKSLEGRGVEAVLGDFLEPESLRPALEGVDTMFLLTPIHPQQVHQATNVIEAARGSGNDPRILRLSVHQASHQSPTRISRQHAEIEDTLAASGLPYTLLRPQSFMQNTLMAAPTVASEDRIYQPMKEGRLGMIDARDIGEAAAKVITEEGHEGKTYTLTGPAAISFHDIAGALSEVLGKEVTYIPVPLEKAKEAMLSRGIPEWMADALNEYAKAHSEGYSDWTTDDFERLTGHSATSYKEFASDFERVFRGG
ncbi:MAG: SDR family oxidoreductase [Rubrobacteraceae bacterium]|nr:SDR family oxidoreductase [Rubrobacteraceae bacterium]